MKRIAIPLAVLIPFAAFSIWVVATEGPLGFLDLAGREPWALQLLLDVAIACTVCTLWMVRDARDRGVRVWPYLVATLFMGSIGVLAYAVARGLALRGTRPRHAAAGPSLATSGG